MKRRKAIYLGVVGVGAIALGAYLLKPKNKGAAYSPFFEGLNKTLKNHKKSIPFLVIDLDALDHNLLEVQKLIRKDVNFRIVVKSLPSNGLLQYAMGKLKTNKLMVFHEPFLTDLANHKNKSYDILLGKPMPVNTASYFYGQLEGNPDFDAENQVQWLIDTKMRAEEYLALAKEKNIKLGVNCEIDVGLHRGGFISTEALKECLTLIKDNPEHLKLSGLMGYDPQIVKIPSIVASVEGSFTKSCNFYKECKQLIKKEFPTLWRDNLTFNGAGSPTIALHKDKESPLNDVSAGSFAVMPSDFDIDTLNGFLPASFIATPILKKMEGTTLPALEKFSGAIPAWDVNQENSYFIYGGSWMANFFEPKGVKANALFGNSTNQMMINSSKETKLEIGDFIFLRPTQSEHVFLQFQDILAYRKGEIVQDWTPINQICES